MVTMFERNVACVLIAMLALWCAAPVAATSADEQAVTLAAEAFVCRSMDDAERIVRMVEQSDGDALRKAMNEWRGQRCTMLPAGAKVFVDLACPRSLVARVRAQGSPDDHFAFVGAVVKDKAAQRRMLEQAVARGSRC